MHSTTKMTFQKIDALAQPIVAAKNAFIVELLLRGEGKHRFVELFIDTDAGVTADLCADVSKELSRELDVKGVIDDRYHLVVSSPGLDRPLKFPRQYSKHVGRTVKVTYTTHERKETLEGELVFADNDSIELRAEKDGVVKLPFDHIVQAHVKPAWEKKLLRQTNKRLK